MAIRHWPAGERPREKLLERGARALSDAELLAIFLRTGHAGKSAVDLARKNGSPLPPSSQYGLLPVVWRTKSKP